MCGENLDCDGALEPGVFCTVDFSHAARAQRRIDFIRPQFCPLSERHKWRDYNPGKPASGTFARGPAPGRTKRAFPPWSTWKTRNATTLLTGRIRRSIRHWL